MQLRHEWKSRAKMLPCNQNGNPQCTVFCETEFFAESSSGDRSLLFPFLHGRTTFMFLVLDLLFEHTKETSMTKQVSCMQNTCSVCLWDVMSKKTENNMAFHGNKRLMIAQNVKKQCCVLLIVIIHATKWTCFPKRKNSVSEKHQLKWSKQQFICFTVLSGARR